MKTILKSVIDKRVDIRLLNSRSIWRIKLIIIALNIGKDEPKKEGKVKREKAKKKEYQKGSKYNEISIIAIMNVAKEELKCKDEENKRSPVKGKTNEKKKNEVKM